jgi:hypothetical protein
MAISFLEQFHAREIRLHSPIARILSVFFADFQRLAGVVRGLGKFS